MTYTVDIRKLVISLLPLKLRTLILVDFLSALVKPVDYLWGLFGGLVANEEKNLTYNITIWGLEKLMNDKFDASQRRILVGDPDEWFSHLFFRSYVTDPQEPVFRAYTQTPSTPVFRSSQAALDAVRVKIVLPLGMTPTTEMTACVKKYIHPGMNFQIIEGGTP